MQKINQKNALIKSVKSFSLLIAILFFNGNSVAIDNIDTTVSFVEAEEFKVDGVNVGFVLNKNNNIGITINIKKVEVFALDKSFENILITCSDFVYTDVRIKCKDAKISVKTDLLDDDSFGVSFDYNMLSKKIKADFNGLMLLGGAHSGSFEASSKDWKVDVEGVISFEKIPDIVSDFAENIPQAPISLSTKYKISSHGKGGKIVALNAALNDLKVFGGSHEVKVSMIKDQWKANIKGDISLESIPEIASSYIKDIPISTFSTKTKYEINSFGSGVDFDLIEADLDIEKLDCEDNNGSGVYEFSSKISASVASGNNVSGSDSSLDFDFESKASKGFFYYLQPSEKEDEEDKFYSFDIAGDSLNTIVLGEYLTVENELNISQADIEMPYVFKVLAKAGISIKNENPINQLEVDLNYLDISKIIEKVEYPSLSSFIDKENITVEGVISGAVSQTRKTIQDPLNTRVIINVDDLSYFDNEGKVGIENFSGNINWSSQKNKSLSIVKWDSANVYKIPMGASQISFTLEEDDLYLNQAKIPIFDGFLKLRSLSVQDIGSKMQRYEVGGIITPISLTEVTDAFEWPTMTGTISGKLPLISYQNHIMKLDGKFSVNVFSGLLEIENLIVEDPLGFIPRISGDIFFDDFDLEELTETFSFGRITGSVDGYMKDMQMEDWQLSKFEAKIATDLNSEKKRKISQRAVDNLSSIGGIGGALSRTYLRFFEQFSYEELGISCVLADGVCQMDGVKPSQNGYFIVVGEWIPRIDIVGFQREVNWDDMIERLKMAANSSGPTLGE